MPGFDQMPFLKSKEGGQDSEKKKTSSAKAKLLAAALSAASPMTHGHGAIESLERPPEVASEAQLKEQDSGAHLKLEQPSEGQDQQEKKSREGAVAQEDEDKEFSDYIFSSESPEEKAQREQMEADEREWARKDDERQVQEYYQKKIDEKFRDPAQEAGVGYREAPVTPQNVGGTVGPAISELERHFQTPADSELEAARKLFGEALDEIGKSKDFNFPDPIEDQVQETGDSVVAMITERALKDVARSAVYSRLRRKVLDDLEASGRINDSNRYLFDSRNPESMSLSKEWKPAPGINVTIGADAMGYDFRFDPHVGASINIELSK
jgi:hypothetical protein